MSYILNESLTSNGKECNDISNNTLESLNSNKKECFNISDNINDSNNSPKESLISNVEYCLQDSCNSYNSCDNIKTFSLKETTFYVSKDLITKETVDSEKFILLTFVQDENLTMNNIEVRVNNFEVYTFEGENFNKELNKYLNKKPSYNREDIQKIEEEISRYVKNSSYLEYFYFSLVLYTYYYNKYYEEYQLPYEFKERFSHNALTIFKSLVIRYNPFDSNLITSWYLSFYNIFSDFFSSLDIMERNISGEINFYLDIIDKNVSHFRSYIDNILIDIKKEIEMMKEIWLYQKRKIKKMKEEIICEIREEKNKKN